MTTVDLHLTLSEETARKLRDLAQARHTTEATIIEQALAMLFDPDEAPALDDYWFSVAAMREDWDAMPDDWIADEASDAVSPR
jgi:predicted transcriptional regulator